MARVHRRTRAHQLHSTQQMSEYLPLSSYKTRVRLITVFETNDTASFQFIWQANDYEHRC